MHGLQPCSSAVHPIAAMRPVCEDRIAQNALLALRRHCVRSTSREGSADCTVASSCTISRRCHLPPCSLRRMRTSSGSQGRTMSASSRCCILCEQAVRPRDGLHMSRAQPASAFPRSQPRELIIPFHIQVMYSHTRRTIQYSIGYTRHCTPIVFSGRVRLPGSPTIRVSDFLRPASSPVYLVS